MSTNKLRNKLNIKNNLKKLYFGNIEASVEQKHR